MTGRDLRSNCCGALVRVVLRHESGFIQTSPTLLISSTNRDSKILSLSRRSYSPISWSAPSRNKPLSSSLRLWESALSAGDPLLTLSLYASPHLNSPASTAKRYFSCSFLSFRSRLAFRSSCSTYDLTLVDRKTFLPVLSCTTAVLHLWR